MATTVIDALTIELGLNPAPFVKGQKAAVTAFTQTKKEAVSAGKQIEESSNKAADSIARIAKEALALGAIFIGFKGLKDFVGDLIGADAALGRFSSNLGQSPQMISAWGMAAERMGGSAAATQKTIEGLARTFYNMKYNGVMPTKEFYQLQAASGKVISTGGDLNRTLSDTAGALRKVYQANPARAHFLAEGLGIDEGTANLMFRFGGSAQAFAAALKRLAPTDADIAASQDLQEHWFALTQTATNLADTLLRTLEPSLEPILKGMSDWIEKNRDWLAGEVSTKVKEFATWIHAINWSEIGSGVTTFATELGKVATALEVIAGLLVANKLAGGLKGLFGGAAASGAGGGILAGLITSFGFFAKGDADYRATHPNGGLPTVYGRGGAALGRPGRVRSYGPGRSPTGGPPSAYIEQPTTPYGSLTRDPTAHGDALANTVDGKPVSKSNPMPVTVIDSQSSTGAGGGIWDTVKSFFGVGSASASTGGGASGAGNIFRKRAGGGGGGADLGTFSGDPGKPGNASAQELMDFLVKKKGWTPAAAAVAAAQANAESSFNPGVEGDKSLQSGIPGVPNGSWGLFQLNRRRLAGLMKFGGANWKNKQVQMEYFALEAEHMLPGWKGQKDLSHANELGKAYEGYRGAIQPARARNAARYLQEYLKGGGKQSSLGPVGGAHLAALSTIQQTRNVTTSTSSNEMHVGAINISTQATDSDGIASSISTSLTRSFQAMPANYGLV